MSAITDLQTSVSNLTAAAASLIKAETDAIAAANAQNDPAIAAAVANINSVTANLVSAAQSIPSAPVSPAAAANVLAPDAPGNPPSPQ